MHVDLHPPHTAFAGGRQLHYSVATLPLQTWLRRLSWKAGRQGGVAAGWGGGPGRVAGRVRWLAGSGDWPGGKAGQVIGGGWIFGVKNVLE